MIKSLYSSELEKIQGEWIKIAKKQIVYLEKMHKIESELIIQQKEIIDYKTEIINDYLMKLTTF